MILAILHFVGLQPILRLLPTAMFSSLFQELKQTLRLLLMAVAVLTILGYLTFF